MSKLSSNESLDTFREIKNQFDELFGSSPVATILMHPYEFDSDGPHELACNDAFLKLHSTTRLKHLGFDDTPSPERLELWDRAWQARIPNPDTARVIREGTCINFSSNHTNDGRFVRLKSVVQFISLGHRELLLVTDEFVDDTSSATQLQDSVPAFESLFRHSSEGAVLSDLHDPRAPIIDCNAAYAEMNGYTREELIGQTMLDFNEHQDPELFQEWLKEDKSNFLDALRFFRISYEGAQRRKDGTIYPVDVVQYMVNLDGREYTLTTVRDASGVRQARTLDLDRNHILELIARDAPLAESLKAACTLIEHQVPEAKCVVYSSLAAQIHTLHEDQLVDMPDALSSIMLGTLYDLAQRNGSTIFDGGRTPIPHELQLLTGAKSCWVFPVRGTEKTPPAAFLIYKERIGTPSAPEFGLINVVDNLIPIAIDQQLLIDQLAHQAKHDILTGLPNRSLFNDRLEYTLALAKRNRKKLGVLFVDLDGFKPVNDSLGHATGDLLLKEVAKRLKNCVRESDTVARMGGDEFTLILANINEAQDAAIVAQKVIAELQQPFQLIDHEIYVTASVGITTFPDQATEADALVIQADSAMYVAKTSGKNSYQFYNPGIAATFQKNLELKAQLRKGLSSNEFQVFYQPEVSIKTGEITGLEALLRWKHPQLGLMLPPSFLPAAEETGLILKIGEWVLEQACGQVQQWQQNLDLPKLHISINISPLQLSRNEFFKSVERVLEETGLPANTLQFEIAESVIMMNVEEAARYMTSLKKMGVRLLVDDFAMSYSSLTYLKKLPVDAIKIDRTFIQSIDHDPVSRSLVEAIITFGHSLEMAVFATGIETARQHQLLSNLGCDFAQGFYFAKPGDTAQTEALLQSHQWQHEYQTALQQKRC